MRPLPPLTHWLAYSGMIPMLAGLMALFITPSVLGIDIAMWFCSYSAIIVAFMAGSIWRYPMTSRYTTVQSNALTLLAWLILLISLQSWYLSAVMLLITAYSIQLCIEHCRQRNLALILPYLQLRCRVTAIVLVIHLLFSITLWLRQ